MRIRRPLRGSGYGRRATVVNLNPRLHYDCLRSRCLTSIMRFALSTSIVVVHGDE